MSHPHTISTCPTQYSSTRVAQVVADEQELVPEVRVAFQHSSLLPKTQCLFVHDYLLSNSFTRITILGWASVVTQVATTHPPTRLMRVNAEQMSQQVEHNDLILALATALCCASFQLRLGADLYSLANFVVAVQKIVRELELVAPLNIVPRALRHLNFRVHAPVLLGDEN